MNFLVGGPAFETVAERAAPIVDAVRERIEAARAQGEGITFKLGSEVIPPKGDAGCATPWPGSWTRRACSTR